MTTRAQLAPWWSKAVTTWLATTVPAPAWGCHLPLHRVLTPNPLPPSRRRMELERPRLQDCVLGAKALQDSETQPKKAFRGAIQEINPLEEPRAKRAEREMKETSSAARKKSQYLQITTQRSAVGEVPPSNQLLNHRKSLPNQPANCKGFFSAGLSSGAFRRGRQFC